MKFNISKFLAKSIAAVVCTSNIYFVSAVEKKESKKFECCICFKEIDLKNTILLKDCEHRCCKKCIKEWIKQGKMTCPICRAKISNDDVCSLFPGLCIYTCDSCGDEFYSFYSYRKYKYFSSHKFCEACYSLFDDLSYDDDSQEDD